MTPPYALDAIVICLAMATVSWLVNSRKDLAEEYDALKQPEQAAKFRAETAALDTKTPDSAKK